MRGEGGYSVVEAVLVFPLLLLLVLMIFQVALWWHARHVALAAAQEGARAARAYHSTAAAGQARAHTYLSAVGAHLLPDPVITVTRTTTTTTVDVQGRIITVVPGLRLMVAESVTSPTERYVPPP